MGRPDIELDDWLIDDVFQPFSEWSEERTGLNHFGLGRLFVLASIPGTFLVVNFFFQGVGAMVVMGIVLALNATYLLITVHEEREAKRQLSSRLMNQDRVMFRWARLFHLLIALFLLALNVASAMQGAWSQFQLSLQIMVTSTLVSSYFFACTLKPPWLKRVRTEKLAPATS